MNASRSRLSRCGWLALLVATGAPAAEPVVVPRLDTPPTLDGRLTEPLWDRCPPIELAGARLRAGFDEQRLYLALDGSPGRLDLRLAGLGGEFDWDRLVLEADSRRSGGSWRAGRRVAAPAWDAARSGTSAELAVTWASLGRPDPRRGDRLAVTLGEPGETVALHLEAINLLANPAGASHINGRLVGWSFSNDNADGRLFSGVVEAGQLVLRFECPGRYAVAQQSVRLRPGRSYALSAEARGAGSIYLRARNVMVPGGESRPSDASYEAGGEPEVWRPLAVRFTAGFDGRCLILVGTTEASALAPVLIRGLTLREVAPPTVAGPAVRVAGGLTVIRRLLWADSRIVKGFCGTPIDGTTASYGWNGRPWEYGDYLAGAGVGYDWAGNEGVHLTLADRRGCDALLIRGGIRARLYGDGAADDAPGNAPLLAELPGGGDRTRVNFGRRVTDRRFSFFDLGDGRLADVQAFRIDRRETPLLEPLQPLETGADPTPATRRWLERKYGPDDRRLGRLPDPTSRLTLPPGPALHLCGEPLTGELAVGGVSLWLRAEPDVDRAPLTVTVHDPLNPRLDLIEVDLDLNQPGGLMHLRFPAQLWPAGSQPWLTLRSPFDVALLPPAEGLPRLGLLTLARAEALPEATAHRLLLLKTFFAAASEQRPWTGWRADTDLEAWAAANDGEQALEVARTIDQATALAPDDELLRQYRDWVYRRRQPVTVTARIDPVPGAPEWAVVVRQAWLEARAVAAWWLDHRLTPNGELGGRVGDDSDMYQNWADLPLFETDGVGGRVKAAGEALLSLAETTCLRDGLNRRTMDPLHAYEEGVNQIALVNFWNYGDPVAFTRCLENARHTERLTLKTPAGRFFRSQLMGAEDLRTERPPDTDGHASPLMWHPSLEVLWYQRQPLLQQWLDEYAAGWLPTQRPPAYALSIESAKGTVKTTGQHAFEGGYGSQAGTFASLFLLTGDRRYIEPLLEEFRRRGTSRQGTELLPDLAELLPADALGDRREEILRAHPVCAWRVFGDRQPLLDALKRDIGELQRFGAMYTTAEPFTDRVFLYPLERAALAYLGGMWTRNRYTRDHGVSWSGFGLDYAALVRTNATDAFRVLLYNFADRPRVGAARLWRLSHGMYRLRLGPDLDEDGQPDEVTREETLALGRGSRLAVALPPGRTIALELVRLQPLDELRDRADLALSPAELTVTATGVEGLVHNLGAAATEPTRIDLRRPDGQVAARGNLPALEAPTDLRPRTHRFRLPAPGAGPGWRVVIDPGDIIPEVDEFNNQAELPATAP